VIHRRRSSDDEADDELNSLEDARMRAIRRAADEDDSATTRDDETGWFARWRALLVVSTILIFIARVRSALKRRAPATISPLRHRS
jgi:hypothetical protein